MNRFLNWRSLFPDLSADAGLDALMSCGQRLELPANTPVFAPGAPCRNYLLVAAGRVRVQLLTAGGREVVLYHVGAGESCVLTTSCLLGRTSYPAEGVTETAVTALALSAGDFDRGLDSSAAFRRLVFGNLGDRLTDVILRMEQVAFGPIDGRLAGSLLKLAAQTNPVQLTHQALALELGSAREVVSRHLKRFEDQGWVRLRRGSVELLDPVALTQLSGSGRE